MKRPLAAVVSPDESPTSAEVFKQAKRVAQSPSARFANLRLLPPAVRTTSEADTRIPQGRETQPKSPKSQRLPVFTHQHEILHAIENNDVVLIAGDTGCGKSTGIPQILFKHHLKKQGKKVSIVVTQPRVVAATSLATRVADQFARDKELVSLIGPRVNLGLGGVVGYRVRFEDRVSPKETRVTFATDGLVIRECLYDVTRGQSSTSPTAFRRYDYVVIDEAHERSLRIDELLGLAKVALCHPGRNFKLLVMSATLDTKTFVSFFASDRFRTGHVTIPGRTFPVSLNYLKASCSDYMDAAMAAVCQVMVTSETGDILVFLPGADDIKSLCSQLEQRIIELTTFAKLTNDVERFLKILRGSDNLDTKSKLLSCSNPQALQSLLRTMFDITYLTEEEVASLFRCVEKANYGYYFDLIVQYKLSDSLSLPSKLDQTKWLSTQWTVLPLFSQLSYQDQQKVFLPPKHACHRKIIVSTNIAETSITLPNIKFVIDSGKVKQKFLNTLKTVDVSRAMSKQRSGRAGRVQEGTAFRLYTEDHFFALEEQALPEIARCDLGELLLDLKTVDGSNRQFSSYLGVGSQTPLTISNFPLPTMPPKEAIQDAETLLCQLGALDNTCAQIVTQRGLQLSALPLPVIWSNLVLESIARGCVLEIITIAAMAALDEDWYPQSVVDQGMTDIGSKRKRLLFPDSDHLGLLNLYNCWQQASDKKHFCRMVGVDEKALHKAKLIREQLRSVLSKGAVFGLKEVSSVLQGVEAKEAVAAAHETLRECLAFGLYTNIAVKQSDTTEDSKSSDTATEYLSLFSKETIIVHPSSAFYVFKHKRPSCIVFSSVIETQRKYARDVTAVNPEWVVQIQATKNISTRNSPVPAATPKDPSKH